FLRHLRSYRHLYKKLLLPNKQSHDYLILVRWFHFVVTTLQSQFESHAFFLIHYDLMNNFATYDQFPPLIDDCFLRHARYTRLKYDDFLPHNVLKQFRAPLLYTIHQYYQKFHEWRFPLDRFPSWLDLVRHFQLVGSPDEYHLESFLQETHNGLQLVACSHLEFLLIAVEKFYSALHKHLGVDPLNLLNHTFLFLLLPKHLVLL